MPSLTKLVGLALTFCAGIFLILGSATNKAVSTGSPISDADFDHYSGVGKCSIEGQVFLKTRGGDVKYGAGDNVTLLPDIALLDEILRINEKVGQYASLPPEVDRK